MSGKGRSSDSGQSNASGTGRSSGGGCCKNEKKQSNESSNNNATNQKKMTDQQFAPKQPRKAHSVTCNQSKDHIVLQTQWTCDHGLDMADSLLQLKDQAPGTEPTRQTVKMTAEEAKDEAAKLLKTLEQQGHDPKHKEELQNCRERRKKCVESKPKACALTLGHCDKKMQARVKESPDFESKVQNDPIESLKIIKIKMCDPSRTKCEHATLASALRTSLGCQQTDEEDLLACTQRFKQDREILKSAVGDK